MTIYECLLCLAPVNEVLTPNQFIFMKTITRQLLAALSFIAVFASCSRPVAYFQPTAREHFAVAPAQANTVAAAAAPVNAIETPVVITPAQQQVQATTAMDQVDALVRNDGKLSADKTVQKRLNKVRTMLAKTSTESTVAANTSVTAKKMSFMERLMVKKINKKITKQLAPQNPEQAMAIKGVLAAGAILVLAGLLLVILTSGTAASIGLVALIVGLVLLLIGLL